MFFVAAKMPKDFEAILCGVRELSKRHKQHAVKQWQRESEKGTVRGGGGEGPCCSWCQAVGSWPNGTAQKRAKEII